MNSRRSLLEDILHMQAVIKLPAKRGKKKNYGGALILVMKIKELFITVMRVRQRPNPNFSPWFYNLALPLSFGLW